ncbi:hypothetical protein [Candidatus Magnetomonas plexicatena]|uniref:hypothetical protein n=1 Tax=Candidatus Magnetomonas plexicatena TaxID=2552947 RepID=UPI001C7606B4|nr:hypothetical protein E2O03_011725 [Nitrospirales bacterium LBB_01]
MMTAGLNNVSESKVCDFVIFTSGSGSTFAVPSEDVFEMLSIDEALRADERILYLDKILGFTKTQGASRVCFAVKSTNTLLAVGDLLDVESIRLDSISPLPAVIVKHMKMKSIWAAVLRAEKLLLLIDFKKLTSETKEDDNSDDN